MIDCQPHDRNNRSHRRRRRGVAVLVVMLLLSVTLALSYASIRSQFTGMLIHENVKRRSSARHAAMVGMAMAIKDMNLTSWAGVDNAIAGTLSSTEGYAVTFATGDPSLSDGDSDYDDYPYRVTVLSTGYAIDSDNPARNSEYRIQAVLQLVPRALSDEPAGFTDISRYSLCQWAPGSAYLNVPSNIAGPVRLRSQFHFCGRMAWDNDARWRYLDDLRKAADAGASDFRPLSDHITYPYADQTSTTRSLVATALGVAEQDGSSSAEFAWPGSDLSGSYRLYPGGKRYRPEAVRSSLTNVTLEPDPIDNPLGIFVRSGRLRLHENVTIQGTLITTGGSSADMEIDGEGIKLLPNDLPPLYGEDTAVRLPTIISADDLLLQLGAEVTAGGLLFAVDDFTIDREDQDDISLSLSGTVAGKDIKLWERTDWDRSVSWWRSRWSEFNAQLGGTNPVDDWPLWLEIHHGFDRQPKIVIEPEADSPRYHWYNPENPLFAVHPDDDGLRWNLLRWTENP